MKKRRVTAIILAVVIVVGIAAFSFYRYDRARSFYRDEKNSFAMGTVVSQKAYSPYGAKHIEKVNAMLNGLENEISRNRENSAVSILNGEGFAQSVQTAELIRICNELSEKTKGAFDITVGGIVDLWDFAGENEGIPSQDELEKELREKGYEKLTVSEDEITLSSKAEVDLGAVGKGLGCDMAISYYRATDDCEGAIISVGGSVGCFGKHNKQGDKWRIALRHPRQENSFLGVISLDEGFVSTSGDYEKYFIENDVRYHHILDARTGYPASSGLISVTVICDSGLLSDALSTACFILGEKESLPLLEEYKASAIFVSEDMTVTTVGEVEFERQ